MEKDSPNNSKIDYFNSNFSLGFGQKIYVFFKRILDIFISLSALIIFSPFLIIVACLIKVSSRGPIIFSQERVGRNNKIIKIYKFRTMKVTTPKNLATAQIKDLNNSLTSIGKFLRTTSIDEFPQLLNVLKGEMSLIGPRPIILQEKKIHELRNKNNIYVLKPGITGLAQINGRDFLDVETKVRFDTEYLKNFSFSQDIKITLKSIGAVFKQKGFLENKK